MRSSKWTKWKIGAAGAIGLALLFHEVKDSAAFEQAYAKQSAASADIVNPVQQQDRVKEEWSRQRTPSSAGSDTLSRDNNRSSTQQTSPSTVPQTRTRRS